MAKLAIKKALTSVALYLFIQNSSVTTGAGLTGLVFNSASLVAYYVRPLAAAAAITLATQTVTGAFSSGGFVEVDATNMPGVYRFDVPNAALATGVNSVVVMLKGATNMVPVVLEIDLVAYDPQSATNLGLSQIDAATSSRMATYTQPAGFLAATFPAGTVANTTNITAGTITTATNLTNLPAAAALEATLTDMKGSTFAGATDSLEAIRDRGDAAWITATGFATSGQATAIQADTDDIQARLPAALTAGGSIKADALAWNGLATVALPATPTNITAATGIVLSGVTHTGAVIPTVSTLTGHTAQTGDSFARLGAPAGASVSADIAAVDTVVDAIKVKTDSLTFTQAGHVDSNVQRINDVTIVGDGSATPFNV